jgi:2-polyprenyl-6-methoxyphenol hydroxylase-like FAD-dependent oxidoreductase
LTTAFGLARAGHRVRVLEKASEIVRNGSGMRLTPNSVSILARWGLEGEIARISAPLPGSRFIDSASHLF